MAELEGDVGLKDVFDRTHQRKEPSGPVYVKEKAHEGGLSDSKSQICSVLIL